MQSTKFLADIQDAHCFRGGKIPVMEMLRFASVLREKKLNNGKLEGNVGWTNNKGLWILENGGLKAVEN